MNLTEKLIKWYCQHKRDLPWRNTSDPYLIWLSEIILQQTRIDQGMDYYLKFQKRFPNVYKLAEAPEDQILKLWQGLGYYTRARNLHKAAKQIVQDHQGRFPEQYEDILALPGIGEYTSAAIASIAFGAAYPVIDGNVMRVISRIYGIDIPLNTNKGKKEIIQILNKHIDRNDPGTFNQAMMEFGALHCKPVNPNCRDCIFKTDCYANQKGMVDQLPSKKQKIKIKKRYFNYLVFVSTDAGFTWLTKRIGKDIWQNLYEFPLVEHKSLLSRQGLIKLLDKASIPMDQIEIRKSNHDYKHILTHQQIHARFFIIKAPANFSGKWQQKLQMNEALEVNKGDLDLFAISRLTDRFLKENNIFD